MQRAEMPTGPRDRVRILALVANAVVRRLVLRFSRRHPVQVFDVRDFTLGDLPPDGAVSKVTAALELLAKHDPVRFGRIKRDVRCILITGTAGNVAEYHHGVQACCLDVEYLARDDVTPALVAGTIAHEATHARIRSAGFRYPPALRARIEKLCFEAEVAVGRRLPDGEAVIVQAERQLARDPSVWTDEARRARAAGALQRLGMPRWFLRMFGADKPAAYPPAI